MSLPIAIETSWYPSEPFPFIVLLALGLCFGSFLNVVIYRLPLGLSLSHPRSRCGSCETPIRWYHNVPVVAWILLRGRCAYCRASIAPRYPLVELTGGGLTLLAVYSAQTPVQSVAGLWLLLSLLVVFFIDIDHRIIPDEISLGGTALGWVLSFWTFGIWNAVIASVVGALSLYLVGWLYQRARGVAGMGLGDVKLAAMLGAFLGLQGLLLTVLLASFLGSFIGVVMILARRGSGQTALPFGSFLAPAAVVVSIWGGSIWQWYLGFFPQVLAP